MPQDNSQQQDSNAEVRQILEAEQRAERRLATERQTARAVIAKARRTARAIEGRGDRRIVRVQNWCEAQAREAATLGRKERHRRLSVVGSGDSDDTLWQAAVERVARRLLGQSGGVL